MTATVPPPCRPAALPRADWRDQEPYRSERKDGRPRSCPMQIMVDGRVWRYVGGLIEGAPEYRREGLTFGSLFAGIGGFDLGFEAAGMQCRWQVEKDADARALLARRYPHAVQRDDVRTSGATNLEPVDVICGGFPCQDLSVAGNRAGLSGDRSGLFYEMVRITNELRPAFLVWENVPGLLSSDGGRDFARVLRALDDIGYSGAWTGLDAQFFGLAQRRQRIFGVFARDDIGAEPCAEILALTARLPWNTPARRPTRADVAATIRAGSSGDGVNRPGRRGDDDVNIVSLAENQRGELRTADIAAQLTTGGGKPGQGYPAVFVPAIAQCNRGHATGDLAETLRADSNGALPMVFGGNDTTGERSVAAALTAHGSGRYDFESENFVVCGAQSAAQGGPDDNSAQANHLVLTVALRGREGGAAIELGGEQANALRASQGGSDKAMVLATPLLEIGKRTNGDGARDGDGIGREGDPMYTLQAGAQHGVGSPSGVRRLTPLECERLQGFPDGWTAGQSDSTRYRQLGNAVAVTVTTWLGRRIVEVCDAAD